MLLITRPAGVGLLKICGRPLCGTYWQRQGTNGDDRLSGGTYGGRLKNGIHIPQLFGAPGFMASPRVLKQCNADGVSLPGLVDAWVGVDRMPTDIVRWIMGG